MPVAASYTMDSSSYTVNAGQSVTFTARVIGGTTTPTGSVTFWASGNAIAGCASVALSNGQALCTTAGLAGGTFQITGDYSGDAAYIRGVAGPITQTVVGAPAPMTLGIVASRYSVNVGQPVTFTVTIRGGYPPTGTIRFTDGSNAIAGCNSVNVSSGTASCTTKALAHGSHSIRGWYSGDSTNGAGVAGPITETIN
jgi:hypothetical protein